MRKTDEELNRISVIMCLLPILMGVYYYRFLPEKIAIHFDVNGVANSFIAKELGIVALPVLLAIVQIVINIAVDKSSVPSKGSYFIKSIVPIASIVTQALVIAYALDDKVNVVKLVIFGVGILQIIIGNYMPKYSMFGNENIRLGSLGKNSKATKVIRDYSKLFVLGGILILISGFFKTAVSLMVIIIFSVLVIIYPNYLVKKYQK